MRELDNIVADILVVDDEVPHAEVVAEALARLGHRTTTVHTGAEAIARVKAQHFDVVVTDLVLGGQEDGLAVLAAVRQDSPGSEVILITAHSSVATCRQALQQGAFDYIEKPLDLDELRAVVQRAAERTAQERTIRELRQRLDEKYGFEDIVGQSAAMLRILDTVRRVAPSDIPVLILGESGTGKELLASAIHLHSRRKEHRLVAINCAGLSETLLEDELFGHVKGAYTGAAADRPGRFEHADGGTMFLDEVGDMPLAMQAKLLRVLENGEVVRAGLQRGRARGRPPDLRHQPRPGRPGGREEVPRGPLLPHQGRDHRHPAAAPAAGGHPAPDRPLPQAGRRGARQEGGRACRPRRGAC